MCRCFGLKKKSEKVNKGSVTIELIIKNNSLELCSYVTDKPMLPAGYYIQEKSVIIDKVNNFLRFYSASA